MSMLKVIDLRGGTKSEAAFGAEANIVQKMQTATGGKVSGDEWNNFAESGGNAAKKLRTDAFYYQMQPLIEKLGGKSAGAGPRPVRQRARGQGVRTRRATAGGARPRRSEATHRKNGAIAACRARWHAATCCRRRRSNGSKRCCCRSSPPKASRFPDKVKAELAKLFPDKAAGSLLTTMYDQREQIHDTERQSAAADGVTGMRAKAADSTAGRGRRPRAVA